MSERTVEEIARQIANTYGVGWATSRLYADVFAALRTEREARPDFPANWNDLSPAVQRAMAQFWQKLSVRERAARVKAEYELKRWKEAHANKPDWEKLWAEQVEAKEKAEAELEADRKAAKLIREAADLIGTSDTLTALREAIARVERAEAARDEWKAAFEAENLKAHRAGVTQQGALNRLNAAEAEAARLREALTKIAGMDKAHEHDLFSATQVARAALSQDPTPSPQTETENGN